MLVLPLVAMGAVAVGIFATTGDDVQPLSKTDGWRDGLWASFDGGAQDPPFALVEIAYDRETAERAWAANVPDDAPARSGRPDTDGRYGNLDDVDFATHAVVVWSSGQSGTCPGWLAEIHTEDGAVSVTTRESGSACTDDYRPYRMVLAVRLDRLPDPAALPTTEVLVDGRALHWGSLVRSYPTR